MDARANPKGLRKAAILIVLLGEEVASHIYRNLAEQDVHRLTQEIADLDRISPETAVAVLDEYHKLALTQDYLAQGGTEYAEKLLIKAFGEDGARQLLQHVHTRRRNEREQTRFFAEVRSAAARQVSGTRTSADNRACPGAFDGQTSIGSAATPSRGDAGGGGKTTGPTAPVFSRRGTKNLKCSPSKA